LFSTGEQQIWQAYLPGVPAIRLFPTGEQQIWQAYLQTQTQKPHQLLEERTMLELLRRLMATQTVAGNANRAPATTGAGPLHQRCQLLQQLVQGLRCQALHQLLQELLQERQILELLRRLLMVWPHRN
jgi:hypothetical protein